MENMLALSWKEPFATLMIAGNKIETRTWETKVRGLVLICSSLKPYTTDESLAIMGQDNFNRAGNVFLATGMWPKLTTGPSTYGKAIGIGRLVDCRPMKSKDEERCFVEYSPDLWCHEYTEVQTIDPFPFVGGQKWRKIEVSLRQQLHIKYGI